MDLPDGVPSGLAPLALAPTSVLDPDLVAEPAGYLVAVGERDRIHFLDWGGPEDPGIDAAGPDAAPAAAPGVLLIHGFASTAWSWAPVARRLGRIARTVAMDLRGHGLSDAPTEGYDAWTIAEDVVAVAEGAGLVDPPSDDPDGSGGPSGSAPAGMPARRVVLVGHGFGAAVAAWAAGALGPRCAGVVLVDGGWEDLRATTGLEPEELLRGTDEPPEVMRSMRAFLADRRTWDPASWDDDQERAARASVVELPSGRVEAAIHPHVRVATVEAMLSYRPVEALAAVEGPIAALVAGMDETREAALAATARELLAVRWAPVRVARFPSAGHNLMRYQPAEVAAAIAAVASTAPVGATSDPTAAAPRTEPT